MAIGEWNSSERSDSGPSLSHYKRTETKIKERYSVRLAAPRFCGRAVCVPPRRVEGTQGRYRARRGAASRRWEPQREAGRGARRSARLISFTRQSARGTAERRRSAPYLQNPTFESESESECTVRRCRNYISRAATTDGGRARRARRAEVWSRGGREDRTTAKYE